jgi:chemotaxis protein MotB
MAQDLDPLKLSSPRIFLVRMMVFLILCGLIVVVLYRQIWGAFLANPGLNALIIGVLLIGIALAFRQVIRLFPEVNWVNGFRLADPGLAVERPPVLLAPMAALLGDRIGRMAISSQMMRGILDSIAARLDEARDLSRYMTGLLIFLGLLGTFWGLIETVGSVGKVIEGLKVGGDGAAIFDALKEGLAAPLAGMGISFSSSLFGLAGSLALGFLDLQTSQAQNRFYTDLEDWLSTTVRDLGAGGEPVAEGAPAFSNDLRVAIEKLKETIIESGSSRQATSAMANLAEAIQGLVHHMRTEQQMIRDWVDSQAEQHREIRRLLEIVDALSTLVLGIIFLLTVFVVLQFYLTQEVTGKDTALSRLTAQISQLTDLLSLEKTGKLDIEEQLASLRANLATAEGERERFRGLYDGVARGGVDAQGRAAELSTQIDAEKRTTVRALAQVEVLNQQIAALRRQLAALEEALDASDKKDKESQTRMADLGQRLNVALAQRVQELSRYRSDFFGRLRAILGNRPDIRVVGDRFVFQSEVFFDTGQAVLRPEGRTEVDKLAAALIELEKQIPGEIAWVLRVDGHTDIRPTSTASQYRTNWDLSAARAISVVQYMISKGVSPQRLVAAGFGEFQPIDPERTEEAFSRNRRIELKLTER